MVDARAQEMTVSANKPLPLSLDNALQVLITALIGLVGYMQQKSDERLQTVEKDVVTIKESIAELKTHLRYVNGAKSSFYDGSTMHNSTGPLAGGAGDPSSLDSVPN